jgi:hypothetical protein
VHPTVARGTDGAERVSRAELGALPQPITTTFTTIFTKIASGEVHHAAELSTAHAWALAIGQ